MVFPPEQIKRFEEFAVITGGTQASASSRKLSKAISSLFPFEEQRILKVSVVPVPAIDLVNVVKFVVSNAPFPIPSPLVSSARDLLLIPLAVLLLAKKLKRG